MELKFYCNKKDQETPCKVMGKENCFECMFFSIGAPKPSRGSFLNQALNEGDGVYRP